jgi:hypothetical protein
MNPAQKLLFSSAWSKVITEQRGFSVKPARSFPDCSNFPHDQLPPKGYDPMAASRKPELAILTKDKPTEIATFKNSLRLWQAQWKAQKAAREALRGEDPKAFPRSDAS